MAIRDVRTINMINGSISPNRPNQHDPDPDKTTSRNSLFITFRQNADNRKCIDTSRWWVFGCFWLRCFQSPFQKEVKIDIVAGTSIGGVNAAIIAGSKDGNRPEQFLEQFWLELADSFVDLENVNTFLIPVHGKANRQIPIISSPLDRKESKMNLKERLEEYRRKPKKSFISSAMFGNDKMFKARWRPEYALTDPQYFEPAKWTYLYDHSPLTITLQKYIDYDKLKPNGNPNSRLIMTAVNVLTAEATDF